MQMLYFSIRDTREKNLIKSLFPANEKMIGLTFKVTEHSFVRGERQFA